VVVEDKWIDVKYPMWIRRKKAQRKRIFFSIVTSKGFNYIAKYSSPWGHFFIIVSWCETEMAEKVEAQLASEKEGAV